MDKPWDVLRGYAPMGLGSWQTSTTDLPVNVELKKMNYCPPDSWAEIVFTMSNGGLPRFTPTELRQVSQFMAELADQLEAE